MTARAGFPRGAERLPLRPRPGTRRSALISSDMKSSLILIDMGCPLSPGESREPIRGAIAVRLPRTRRDHPGRYRW
jgi:hypothetical protein